MLVSGIAQIHTYIDTCCRRQTRSRLAFGGVHLGSMVKCAKWISRKAATAAAAKPFELCKRWRSTELQIQPDSVEAVLRYKHRRADTDAWLIKPAKGYHICRFCLLGSAPSWTFCARSEITQRECGSTRRGSPACRRVTAGGYTITSQASYKLTQFYGIHCFLFIFIALALII